MINRHKIHIVIGIIGSILFGGLAILNLTKTPYRLDSRLVELSGRVVETRIEGITKHKDLLIRVDSSDLWYRSPMAYPSAFKYGSKTAESIPPGKYVTLIVEKSEYDAAPRKHRVKAYDWKGFVGLSSGNVSHLSPKNHQNWEQKNDTLAKYMLPVFSILSVCLIIISGRKLSLQNSRD